MSNIDKLIKTSPLKRLTLMLIILISIIISYYFLGYMPLEREIKKLEEENLNLTTKYNQFKVKQENYLADLKKLNQLESSYVYLRRVLPSTTEIASFLSQLHEQSELAGLELLLIQPMDEEPQEFYIKIPVKLELKGRYHSLAKFFYNVGRLDRIINIEDIHLGEPTFEKGDIMLHAKVMATTFKSVEESEESLK